MPKRDRHSFETTKLYLDSSESLVANIKGLSGNTVVLTDLRNLLENSDDWLYTEGTRLIPLLAELNPTTYSLGYLYILEACASAAFTEEQGVEILRSLIQFIYKCTAEQICLAPEKFVSVCRRLKFHLSCLDDPMRGVAPMLTAVRKLQSCIAQLTTIHQDFLLLCLLSRCYRLGSSILDDDIYIFAIDHDRDLFLYCYYGGMICIGQKEFEKALELLHVVVTSPMPTLSRIAVEAYKKYILVSLIHLGQFSASLPQYTSKAAQRNLEDYSQPYLGLAQSYNSGKVSELETIVQRNKVMFEIDRNLGLVKQVVSSMYKHNIQKLTKTYLTLSLQDIADAVQLNTPKEAEIKVLHMIQERQIYATINQKDGMVRFLEDREQYKTCRMIDHIGLSIRRMIRLSKGLTTINDMMSRDPSYLRESIVKANKAQIFDFDIDTVSSDFLAMVVD